MSATRTTRVLFLLCCFCRGFAATADVNRFSPCEIRLQPIRFGHSTIVPDVQTLVGDPDFLLKAAGSRVVLSTGVISQLRHLAKDPDYGELVGHFEQSLEGLALPTPENAEVQLPHGGTLVVEARNFVAALGDANIDREDPQSQLIAVAHHWQTKDSSTALISNDPLLQFTAAALGVRTERYEAYNPLTDPNARDVFPIEVTDEQIKAFLEKGELPIWAEFAQTAVQPNQFVQMSSPGTRASRLTVGRYVFERARPIAGRSTWIDGGFKAGEDIQIEFADTIRVLIEGEEIPRVDRNQRGDGGWRFDPKTNLIHFEGPHYRATTRSNIVVMAQQRPHRLQRIRTFEEHRVPGHARKFEQLLAMDLLMDPTIDSVIIIGKAGTAKTFLAAAAADSLVTQKKTDHVKLLRPPRHLGGHDSGTLPGDGDAKNAPWWGGVIDNLREVEKFKKDGRPGMTTLPDHFRPLDFGFTRGRSISGVVMLLDEAQNTTRGEMLAISTRPSRDTRIFMLGDVSKDQVDDQALLGPSNNGLAAAVLRYHMPYVTLEEKSRVAILRLRHVSRSESARIAGRVFGGRR